MDEIADLIRLLAEAPAEEAPMTRPKELLDRVAIERVAQQGVVQPGPAVPDARVNTATTETGAQPEPKPPRPVSINPSRFNFRQPESIVGAMPNPVQQVKGMTANPRTGIPNVDVQVKVTPFNTATTVASMAPETFNARVATPQMLESIAGMPASVRQQETLVAVASPTPRSQVTITVPPAFPVDPKEAFSAVDEQVQLPPRPDPIQRDIRANFDDLQLESTEAFVSRSFQSMEGARSDLDRFIL